jgi:hypothetical protein
VGELVLLLGGHLGEGAAVALDRGDDRVVAEAGLAPGRLGDPGLDGAEHHDLAAVGPRRRGGAHVAAAPPAVGHVLQLAQHPRDPVVLGGPAGRVDARLAAQGVDLDAGVVGDGEVAGGGRGGPGLEQGVLLEGGPGLLDLLGEGLDRPPVGAQDGRDLLHLVVVARGEHERAGRGRGAHRDGGTGGRNGGATATICR